MRFHNLKLRTLAGALLAGLAACGGPEREMGKSGVASNPTTTEGVDETAIKEGMFSTRTIGKPLEGRPMITDLAIIDLDQDGRLDIVVCDGRANTVSWIRQERAGVFVEKELSRTISGPAHVEGIDLDQDGDTDLLIASMGIVTPNNDRIGAVVVLENDGSTNFRKRVLIEKVARVTDVQAGDLDGDGDLDLVVGQFGYAQGEIRWMENLGEWRFKSHPLLDLSGTIHTPVVDIDGDHDLDIVALVSQEWEDIYIFENGPSGMMRRVAYGSTNEDYGSSGISISDLDGDGDSDILYTNGDAFDYSVPGPRPWHGVQWLENNGQGYFHFRRLGDFPGAYSPTATDLDGDGDLDVVAVSTVNDWGREDPVAMVCFEQVAPRDFRKRVLAIDPPRLMALDAGDIDGDGKIELVTGGFFTFPPYEKMTRVLLWDQ